MVQKIIPCKFSTRNEERRHAIINRYDSKCDNIYTMYIIHVKIRQKKTTCIGRILCSNGIKIYKKRMEDKCYVRRAAQESEIQEKRTRIVRK